MKRFLPLIVLLLGVIFVASTLFPRKAASEYDLDGFGRLPVLVNGRIKPLDTVARTTLLTVQGRQRVVTPDGKTITPTEWLLNVCFTPGDADKTRCFEIVHPDVLALLNLTAEDGDGKKRFSFSQIAPSVAELERQARLADGVDEKERSKFQKALLTLYTNLTTYQRLEYSLVLPDSPDFLNELTQFQNNLGKAVAAAKAREAGQPYDADILKAVATARNRFETLAQQGTLLAIPPLDPSHPNAWRKTGQSLMDTFDTGVLDPAALTYAGLGYTWRTNSPKDFNEIVRLYRLELAKRFSPALSKSDVESRFNAAEPFYIGMYLYVLALLLGLFSWLRWPEVLGKSGFYLLALAWALTTAGILTRMWLESRPPVTNLYSSALFVGWCAVTLCLVLELIYKNAIGTVAGGLMGFATLIIAHHLAFTGDTMEMMRAVLDSNFWLGTHVVTITIGYGATFLAGILAIIYIVMGLFTGWLNRQFDKGSTLMIAAASAVAAGPVAAVLASGIAQKTSMKGETNGQALTRMVYGIVCFATLFSLVGTILGGIWADQSWGRFWGWDPKENGALIIVLWNATILHCRWGGLVKTRGLMALAVFGNIVTSWSWFGVNMLGVGLHSYGFMDSTFWALISFVVTQLIIIAIALIPLEKWKSFQPAKA
jgi:ABC-type transport system involved in cytochrome c biogenesis permease subunit